MMCLSLRPETTHQELWEQDRDDLQLSSSEIKRKETFHGFPDQLTDDIIEYAKQVFSGKCLADNLAMYSSLHVIDVLEIFQELLEDINDFEQEMDELHLLKKQFCIVENQYLISSSISVEFADVESDELVFPQNDLCSHELLSV